MRFSFRFVSALLRHDWLMEASAAEAQLPLVQRLFAEAQLHQDDDSGAAEAKQLDPLHGCFAMSLDSGGVTRTYKTFDEAPAGSTAILSIEGPILKDDFCDVGMGTKAEQIRTAYQHPNIASLLIKFDTPGGQANAPALAADAIREAIAAGVPVLGWVDHGIAASAGYWIGAACSELWLSQATDQVGSIGAYRRVRKASGSDNTLEVYAPQSKQKNLADRKAAQGDTSLLEAELAGVVDVFTQTVTAYRGDRLAAGGDYFEGGMFMGPKAVAAGLADGICSYAAAIERVQQLATEAAPATGNDAPAPAAAPPFLTSDHLTPSLTVDKFPLLCALLGLTALVVDTEKGSYLQAANLDAIEKALAGHATQKTELDTARTDLATRTSERDKAQTDLKTATDKLATYGSLPAAATSAPKLEGEGDRAPAPVADASADPMLASVLALKAELGISNK